MADSPSPTIHTIPNLDALDKLTAAHKYVVLDFWATWCPPCKAIAPIYANLAQKHAVEGVLAFGKVDVDEATDVSSKFGITAMPSFLFLVDGDPGKGVDVTKVEGKTVGGGGVVFAAAAAAAVEGGEGDGGDEKGRVVMIRGADPKNLTAVVEAVAGAAREEGEAAKVN